MTVISEKANRVVAHLAGQNETARVAFDPLTILSLISLVLYIIRALKGCALTPTSAAQSARQPSLLERIVLRRHVRHHLHKNPLLAGHVDRVLDGVLLVGKEVTDVEMTTMYGEEEHQA